jgi:hypothetical protein
MHRFVLWEETKPRSGVGVDAELEPLDARNRDVALRAGDRGRLAALALAEVLADVDRDRESRALEFHLNVLHVRLFRLGFLVCVTVTANESFAS